MPNPPRKRRRARPLGTRVALSLAATGLSCAPAASLPVEPAATIVVPPPAAAAPPSASAAALPPPAEDTAIAEVVARLRAQAVTHDEASQRTLYTWTTIEQIDEIFAQRVLLTRTESPFHGASFADNVLAMYARGGDKLAAQLRTVAFAKARFAWTAPWATLLGWPGETYGDRLIEMELKPEAWIVRLLQTKGTLDVVDLEGRPVPADEALKHPERLAAVYFVHDITEPGAWTYAVARPIYREYVVCNESMIARWAVGTPAMARVIAEGVSVLEALRAALPSARRPALDVATFNLEAGKAWSGAAPLGTIDRAYQAALAFPNELYQLDDARLQQIIWHLRALPSGPVIEHRPTARFSRAAAAKPLAMPKISPPRHGTY